MMSLLLPNSMKIIDKMDFCPLTHHGLSGIWNLSTFSSFLKKLLSIIKIRRAFSRRHTHTHIYMHIRCTSAAHIALFYFWKTELFYQTLFFLLFLSFTMYFEVPFQTTQLQIVSE